MQRRGIFQIGFLLFALALLLFASCQSNRYFSDETGLAGRILIWHGWDGVDAEALDSILAKYEEINPNVDVQWTRIDPELLLATYQEASLSGLGPDLLIGPATWLRTLAEAGLIKSIDGTIEEDTLERFLPAALETVRHAGSLYGLPLTLQPKALYYNKAMVETPATTLDGLLAHAAAGNSVALDTSFYGSFWGIQAFGGALLDAEGHVILDQGGFANWLAWLKAAREQPGMILEANQEALSLRFQEGEVAYYAGDPTESARFREALGEDMVGVVPLPAGLAGNAGPLLAGDVLLFSIVSSPNQAKLASSLAHFLTNVEQQTSLMRAARRVPANVRVRVNSRLNPLVAGFVAQAKTSVPLPDVPDLDALQRQGTDVILRVLEGVQDPVEAVLAFTQSLNESYGFATVPSELVCQGVGIVRLLHNWEGAAADTLAAVVENFEAVCPTIIVQTETASPNEGRSRYQSAAASQRPPDLFLGSSSWIGHLADLGLLKPIDTAVAPEWLQRYRPRTVDALRYQGSLYGLPMAAETQVLYYNRSLVETAAFTLDDLLLRTAEDRPLLLSTRFRDAYWGIQAFGSALIDAENQVVFDQSGFVDWLSWLQSIQNAPGIILSNDADALKRRFLAGNAAYYVGSTGVLSELQAALGAETVGVAVLPTGPENAAAPLLQVAGLFFGAASNDAQTALALEFARYATSLDPQTLLMGQTDWIPVNSTVSSEPNSSEEIFIRQANNAVALPNTPQMSTLLQISGDAYALALTGGYSPGEAVQMVAEQLDSASQLDLSAETPSCEGAGEVTLWHAKSDTLTDLYDRLIDSFMTACPEIRVVQEQLPPATLLNQFVAAGEAGTGPDLLLGPGWWAGELATTGLITDVSALIPPAEVGRLRDNAVAGLDVAGTLYGIPESMAPVALYYNRNQVTVPAATLDELLVHAAEGRRVALTADMYHGHWGISALAEENGLQTPLLPEAKALAAWLAWLVEAKEAPGMLVEADEAKLYTLFISGRLAYFVGGAEHLPALQARMGADVVGVAQLPTGPGGQDASLMQVDGFMISADVGEAQQQLAAQFARYVASRPSQQLLLDQGYQVPIHSGIDGSAVPAIAGFVVQAETAVALPAHPRLTEVLAVGDTGYSAVLRRQVAPVTAAARTVADMAALLAAPE